MNKKLIAILSAGLLTVSLVGCTPKEDEGQDTSSEPKVEEKVETDERTLETLYSPEKKDVVVTTVTFEGDKPVDVNIDVRLEDGKMKKDLAASGDYVMVEGGVPWNEQIEELEKFIVENDFDLSKVTLTNEEGNTDAVSGVSIKVGTYLESVQKVLDGESGELEVEAGFTGDKTVEVLYSEEKKDMVITTVTFEDGKPVDVSIDVKLEDGTMKKDLAASGDYVMVEGGVPWNEQIEELEKFIVESDFDLSKVTLTTEEGNTDAVSGVSIKVGKYLETVQQALDEAK